MAGLEWTATYFGIPESHKTYCVDAHHFYECGHPVQEKAGNKTRDVIRRFKNDYHWRPCSLRGCKILKLNVIIPNRCIPDCPGVTLPVDDLPMINLQRKAKEEWEDATLKGAELEEARRRREERRLEMEKEREHWRRELGDNENIVYFERL
ncbi:hypothetical protein F4820DRAFT_225119 [Hypoxylon rubiginosum]|uniref:Uncharacterized protein n=1 Tax=Hypoxylon rubiginosum TaxID=110542 RepID=A0ACB9Z6J8_9PEZI|nr:hypothetical protein F4820DRAFT_225119 [Hypoxylon rubiginosum]